MRYWIEAYKDCKADNGRTLKLEVINECDVRVVTECNYVETDENCLYGLQGKTPEEQAAWHIEHALKRPQHHINVFNYKARYGMATVGLRKIDGVKASHTYELPA